MAPVRFYADDSTESQKVEEALKEASVQFVRVLLRSHGRTPPAIDCDSGYFEGIAEISVYFLDSLGEAEQSTMRY